MTKNTASVRTAYNRLMASAGLWLALALCWLASMAAVWLLVPTTWLGQIGICLLAWAGAIALLQKAKQQATAATKTVCLELEKLLPARQLVQTTANEPDNH